MTTKNVIHDSKPLRLVYLIPSIHNSGGMERVLCNKANWLVERAGYEVCIVTTDQKGRTPFFAFSPKIRMYDLQVNYTDLQGKNFVAKTAGFLRKQKLHRKKLQSLLDEMRADVVVSMFGPEVSFLYRMRDGSKKVLEIHFSKYFRLQQQRGGVWGLSDKWRTWKDQKYIRQYDKFVVLTQEDKTYWGNLPNIEVIYNAATFTPTETARLENKRVLSVGRLTFQKGYDMLLEAWAKVHARHPDWKLTIVGSGEEHDALRQQIGRLGLTDTVELKAPTSQIQEEYLSSSIYVFSSRFEGFGMVLVEAMSCGLPAVSFACKCGPRDIIQHEKTGLLIPPEDMEALANGICRLIEDKDLRLRMGESAAQDVHEKFSMERIMRQWENLFENVCKKI